MARWKKASMGGVHHWVSFPVGKYLSLYDQLSENTKGSFFFFLLVMFKPIGGSHLHQDDKWLDVDFTT
jgi:hypothetical protein